MVKREDPLHVLHRTPTKASHNNDIAVYTELEKERTQHVKEWGKSRFTKGPPASSPTRRAKTANRYKHAFRTPSRGRRRSSPNRRYSRKNRSPSPPRRPSSPSQHSVLSSAYSNDASSSSISQYDHADAPPSVSSSVHHNTEASMADSTASLSTTETNEETATANIAFAPTTTTSNGDSFRFNSSQPEEQLTSDHHDSSSFEHHESHSDSNGEEESQSVELEGLDDSAGEESFQKTQSSDASSQESLPEDVVEPVENGHEQEFSDPQEEDEEALSQGTSGDGDEDSIEEPSTQVISPSSALQESGLEAVESIEIPDNEDFNESEESEDEESSMEEPQSFRHSAVFFESVTETVESIEIPSTEEELEELQEETDEEETFDDDEERSLEEPKSLSQSFILHGSVAETAESIPDTEDVNEPEGKAEGETFDDDEERSMMEEPQSLSRSSILQESVQEAVQSIEIPDVEEELEELLEGTMEETSTEESSISVIAASAATSEEPVENIDGGEDLEEPQETPQQTPDEESSTKAEDDDDEAEASLEELLQNGSDEEASATTESSTGSIPLSSTDLELVPEAVQLDESANTEELQDTRDPVLRKDDEDLSTEESSAAAVPSRAPVKSVPEAVKQIEIPDRETGMKLFDQLDENASGKLSLAELDKGVMILYPEFNHKPAIMAAYKSADRSDNGFVERNEFGYFLRFLVHYNNLWAVFAAIDTDDDRRISKDEFVAAAEKLDMSRTDAELAFDEIDANSGGMILFDELARWMATNKSTWGSEELQELQDQLEEPAAEEEAPSTTAPPTPSEPIPEAVQKIETPDKETALQLFDQLDENASGKLSLAELDKGIVALFPEWNNKPAIMAAYKSADRSGDGFISRNEFGYFLQYIVYYNNLWAVFAAIDSDDDRRISKDEFVAAAPALELQLDAGKVFDEIDANGGGMILFDELIHWMATNKPTWGSEDADVEEVQKRLQALVIS